MFDVTKCRLCANVKPLIDLIDIKTPTDLNPSLEYKIYYCFQIQVVEDDKLPSTVCSKCYQKVDITYEFTEQVHKAQDLLHRSLGTQILTPDGDNMIDNLKLEYYDDNDNNENENEPTFNIPEVDDCDFIDVKNESQNNDDSLEETSKVTKRKTRSQVNPKSKLFIGNFKEDDDTDEETLKNTKRKTRTQINTARRKRLGSEAVKKEDRRALLILREWKDYKWKCSDCTEEFLSVKELRVHYKDVHKKSPVYKCLECLKVLDKYDGFQKHVRNHRNQHKFCCEICGKFSYNKEHHERHKETHSNERKYMCSTCGNSFKTPGSLKIHERLHLPPELREQYECDTCHKKLASQASLWSHKKLHTGIKEHTCDVCGKIFAQKTNLIQHASLHEEGMPFQCNLCPRSFKTARRLKRHNIVHTNVKPHKCDVCGKTFRAKQTLNDHKAIHSDYFPYECEHCKKGFKLKQLLKVHLRQHTGERPYGCVDCNHRFANWSNYNKHMKSRHGMNMKSPVTQLIHDQQQQMSK
ncbi:zinc finger protein 124-like [Chrysoperla carnea]|uniref:zinc finger protein 124-like n=1 Tax=Chrysoperla carnea TaxID=189513 RepID=UPI001D0874B1|nr:zinc finger protein 124-like [Chrysoperla carnea]